MYSFTSPIHEIISTVLPWINLHKTLGGKPWHHLLAWGYTLGIFKAGKYSPTSYLFYIFKNNYIWKWSMEVILRTTWSQIQLINVMHDGTFGCNDISNELTCIGSWSQGYLELLIYFDWSSTDHFWSTDSHQTCSGRIKRSFFGQAR